MIAPAVNGVEQRLDAILAALERIERLLLALQNAQQPHVAEDGEVTLREPAKATRKR